VYIALAGAHGQGVVDDVGVDAHKPGVMVHCVGSQDTPLDVDKIHDVGVAPGETGVQQTGVTPPGVVGS
jgi:hypothetical protein